MESKPGRKPKPTRDTVLLIEKYQDLAQDVVNPKWFTLDINIDGRINPEIEKILKTFRTRAFKCKFTRKNLFVTVYENVSGDIARLLGLLDSNNGFAIVLTMYKSKEAGIAAQVAFANSRRYVLEDFSLDLSWGDPSKSTVWEITFKATS